MATRRIKKTMVDLVVEGTNIRDSFDFSHALRLLGMGVQASGGWTLPADSRYEYDEENNDLRVKANTENNPQSI